jgi:hypothetical protein
VDSEDRADVVDNLACPGLGAGWTSSRILTLAS